MNETKDEHRRRLNRERYHREFKLQKKCKKYTPKPDYTYPIDQIRDITMEEWQIEMKEIDRACQFFRAYIQAKMKDKKVE